MVYLGLGSNEGDRELNLYMACTWLEKVFTSLEVGPVYESAPMYYRDQSSFLNTVCRGECELPPGELLEKLQSIETRMGRVRGIPMGPRCIDLDILLYENKIVRDPGLEIPHPGIKERQFVLIPLLKLEETLTCPVTSTAYRASLEKLEDQGVFFYKNWEDVSHRFH